MSQRTHVQNQAYVNKSRCTYCQTCDHTRTLLHTPKNRDVQKSFKVCGRLHVENNVFYFPLSYKDLTKKVMCICYFIGSVVKIVLYLHFLYTKDDRFRQIKKKHEWWNNCFSDVLTKRLNLKNFASLFFLIQNNFMF